MPQHTSQSAIPRRTWSVQAVRRKFAQLRDIGEPGRKFVAWLLGIQPELKDDPDVRQVLHDYGPGLGLTEPEPLPLRSS